MIIDKSKISEQTLSFYLKTFSKTEARCFKLLSLLSNALIDCSLVIITVPKTNNINN